MKTFEMLFEVSKNFRYAAAPITFLGIGALVVSGGHYTMDVLIAYWLTSHVFWSFHQVFEMKKEDRSDSPLSRVWFVFSIFDRSYWVLSKSSVCGSLEIS